VEAYRKIRNVLRVLAGNLDGFDPGLHAVPYDRMLEIDRWALARYADAATRIVKAYADYDYPSIFQAASQLITVDLSAFYVDVTKDRMYTFGARSAARRSGQTAMFNIVDGLARNRARIVFPRRLYWMLRLYAALPEPVLDVVMRKLPRKQAAAR